MVHFVALHLAPAGTSMGIRVHRLQSYAASTLEILGLCWVCAIGMLYITVEDTREHDERKSVTALAYSQDAVES